MTEWKGFSDAEEVRAFYSGYWKYSKTPQLDGFWDQATGVWQLPAVEPARADPQPLFWRGSRPSQPWDRDSVDGVRELSAVVKNTLHYADPKDLWFEPASFEWYSRNVGTSEPPPPGDSECLEALVKAQIDCDRLFEVGNMSREDWNACYEDSGRRYRTCRAAQPPGDR